MSGDIGPNLSVIEGRSDTQRRWLQAMCYDSNFICERRSHVRTIVVEEVLSIWAEHGPSTCRACVEQLLSTGLVRVEHARVEQVSNIFRLQQLVVMFCDYSFRGW